jgi:hypothetical protein
MGVCQLFGVTDLLGLLASGGQASVEGDLEGVQRGLPMVAPSFLSTTWLL